MQRLAQQRQKNVVKKTLVYSGVSNECSNKKDNDRTMISDIKNVAAFLAVAIWADGVYSEEENEMLTDIAEALDVNSATLIQQVQEAVATLEDKDDDAIQEYLIDNASAIEEDETKKLLQCAIEIVMADNVITADEVQVLFDLADAMGGEVEHADVTLMLLDLVKYSPEIEVEF